MSRDYAYEALAEATTCDLEANRGELNVALKSIKEQAPELTNYALSDEIHRRAKLYREVMGDEILLTPTALSKHWRRVAEAPAPKRVGVNLSVDRECSTCGGDRFVVVATRPAKQTVWMRERGLEPQGEIEEVAACPSCHSDLDASHWRHDGTRVQSPDPAKVREMMSR